MTDVTFPDETTGSDFTADQVNQMKAAINSKLDEVLPVATYPLSRSMTVPLAPSAGAAFDHYGTIQELLKILVSTLAQGDSTFWDLANFRFAPLALSPMDPNDFVLNTALMASITAATKAAAGKVALATTAQVAGFSDNTHAVTPAALASSPLGVKSLTYTIFGPTADVVVGDGAAYVFLPSDVNGMILTRVRFFGITAGVTGSSTFQINAPGGDVLTTVATIAAGATGPSTGQVIGTANRAAATDARWRFDVKTKTTTAMKGLYATLEFAANVAAET